jgi:hypothetical protein
MVVAWTEGDTTRTGEIRLGRIGFASAAALVLKSIAVSLDEPNARDPELSGTVDAPALVWSTFSKARSGGLVRTARAVCHP